MGHAVLILADGFEEIEAITPIDLLRRAGIPLVTLALQERRVTGAHHIVIEADQLFADYHDSPDCVIVPGGPGCGAIGADAAVLDLIRQVRDKGGVVAAICAAPALVLHVAGVLEGRRYTCFPGMEKQVTGAQYTRKAVECDGQLITSLAAGTSAEFAEAIVHQLAGPEAARLVAERTYQPWVRFEA